MSRKVFEYFFDPEELEPFYSELPKSLLSPGVQSDDDDTSTEYAANKPSALESCESTEESIPETKKRGAKKQGTKKQISDDIKAETAPNVSEQHPDRESTFGENLQSRSAPESTELGRTRIRRLLSVHALGQYAFCARSAILATERGDDHDIDEPLPRLTYLPNFDRERIEEMLSDKITRLGFFLLYVVCLAVLMRIGLAEQNRLVFYSSLVVCLGLCLWSLGVFVCILELAIRRRAAIRAEAREPEPEISCTEPVNWWSMLKAGFEPVHFQRPFQHPDLPLEGCPWRVLQRGSQRIPVIKSGGRKLGNNKGELYSKHQVRLVAYALLLESTGHLVVPYGLVFPCDSAHGLAFPITDELRKKAVRMLHHFEQTLSNSQQHQVEPRLPENRNRCTNCDYGKPLAKTTREIEQAYKAGMQLVVLQHHSGDLYCCDCGDRFGSAPPHGLAIKKGLRAIMN